MSWPCRCCHQITIGDCGVNVDGGEAASRQLHLRLARRVGRAFAAFEHTGRGQQLCAVTNGSHRFFGFKEVADQFLDVVVQA